jgi:DNA-directed RNA polymerase specialized sigma24 family protein
VSNEAERKEFRRMLAQCLSSLELKQRAVFIATEFEGKSFKELSLLWEEPIGRIIRVVLTKRIKGAVIGSF